MATIQGVVGGLHFGVARGAGSMLGGSLMASFNARTAFRVMAILAGITSLAYSAIYYGIIRKHEKTKMSQNEKDANETQGNDGESGQMLNKFSQIDANKDIESLDIHVLDNNVSDNNVSDNNVSDKGIHEKSLETSNPQKKDFLNSSHVL